LKFSRLSVKFLSFFSKAFVHRLEISLLITFILKIRCFDEEFPIYKVPICWKRVQTLFHYWNAGRCTFTMSKKKSSTEQENVVHCHWNSQKNEIANIPLIDSWWFRFSRIFDGQGAVPRQVTPRSSESDNQALRFETRRMRKPADRPMSMSFN
jgi:hypothetical protein